MVEHFPPIKRSMVHYGGEDRNPAVQLFGRRFCTDQTVTELLVELLLVASSDKHIDDTIVPGSEVLPPRHVLLNWPGKSPLRYAAKARLNLKLFAFLGASKLETRHSSHKRHYEDLLTDLSSPARLGVPNSSAREETLRTLENLFLGFQGVGGQRTWCAQAFIPFTRQVLAAETIWNETKAAKDEVETWADVTAPDRFLRYFSLGRHRFLARGGELLYLQACNMLSQDSDAVAEWNRVSEAGLRPDECDPVRLHSLFADAVNRILDECPGTVGKLVDFIDSGVNSDTSSATDRDKDGAPRTTSCGWCPSDSWKESLLFVVQFVRICDAAVDPIERLELLELACGLQVLRSLCTQSRRYVAWANGAGPSAPLGYLWAISDPEGNHDIAKQISKRSVQSNQRMIHDAIRHTDILRTVEEQKESDAANPKVKAWKNPYAEADKVYGHKLFLSTAKRIGLIVPRQGTGARFVLNDRLLRCIVMSVVPPGQRVTYETFKRLVLSHFGMAVDDEALCHACAWAGTGRLSTLGGHSDEWLVSMLNAAGMLVRLSDSCSLVLNPFDSGG
ncbi:MAG: hypothetical protein HN976_40665 [Lentisphaerae bacterium]|jgi:hypothetical protein|nr:hypothetical protein [Lentisphaerota bacterium]MBT7061470.1 hypothetical protein [Lentisphaerota bacterium]